MKSAAKRRTADGLLAAALLGLLAAGCGSLGGSSGASVDEVQELKRQVVELQRRATVGEVEAARLKQEIAELEQELAAERAAKQAAEQALEAATATRAGSEAEGKISPFGLDAGIEETELEEPELEPETPVTPPPVPPVPPAPPAAPTEASRAELPAAASPAEQSPEALSLYDEGYTLFHQQRYDQAEQRFRRYLELYPETELADNAHFWIGESHYARGDFAAALSAFTATVELYPRGNKVADALLKAGKCLEALGQPEQARETYREVIDRFPASAAAALAGERLEALP